jgi:hypothetical protein
VEDVTRPNLVDVLDRTVTFVRRFIVLPSDEHADAVALWIVHTYCWQQFEATMYLAITSPQKKSGKTRLLEILQRLVWNPWLITEPSVAALFRKLATGCTLLLDEVDAVFKGKDETAQALRGTLNVGNRVTGTVARAVASGQTVTVVDFPVFGPKALAGIGRVPETLADRSIPVPLQRRRPNQPVERFLWRDVRDEVVQLREDIELALTDDVTKTLRDYRATDIELDDRQLEGWEPLLAIATAAGDDWSERARRAAVAIHGVDDDVSTDTLLLAQIREVFGDEVRVSSFNLVAQLLVRDDGPWAKWWGSNGHDPGHHVAMSELARRLKPYGVEPKKLRVDGQSVPVRGYERRDFEDAWERYL